MELAIGFILDGTVGIPWLCRMLGAKVGKEVCLFFPQMRVGMEMLEIGDDTLFGGQVMPLCMDWHHFEDGAHSISFAKIKIGKDVFLANYSVVQGGNVFEDQTILGISSTVDPDTVVPRNSTYLGSPAKSIGSERNEEDDDLQTSLLQQMVRADAEASSKEHDDEWSIGEAHPCVVRMVSGITPLVSVILMGVLGSSVYFGTTRMIAALGVTNVVGQYLILMVNTVASMMIELTLAILIKRWLCPAFKGRCKRWSYGFLSWLLFQEVIQTLSETILSNIQGTALMAAWLRCLGATVGDGVYYDSQVPTETDQLFIGDGVTILEAPQSLVPHTLDRGFLQFAPIKMGDNSSLSLNACLNLQSKLENGAAVGALSLGMKGELVPARCFGEGIPLVLTNKWPLDFLTKDQIEAVSTGTPWCSKQCCMRLCCCCCTGKTQNNDGEPDGESISLLSTTKSPAKASGSVHYGTSRSECPLETPS